MKMCIRDRDMPFPEKQLPKLKALLKQFEVQDIETAMGLTCLLYTSRCV